MAKIYEVKYNDKLYECKNQKEIADLLGFTQGWISQMIKRNKLETYENIIITKKFKITKDERTSKDNL